MPKLVCHVVYELGSQLPLEDQGFKGYVCHSIIDIYLFTYICRHMFVRGQFVLLDHVDISFFVFLLNNNPFLKEKT